MLKLDYSPVCHNSSGLYSEQDPHNGREAADARGCARSAHLRASGTRFEINLLYVMLFI